MKRAFSVKSKTFLIVFEGLSFGEKLYVTLMNWYEDSSQDVLPK